MKNIRTQSHTYMNGADCERGGFSVAKLSIITSRLVFGRGICMTSLPS